MVFSVIFSIVFVFCFDNNNKEYSIVRILACVGWAVLSLLFILRDNKIVKIYKQCLEDAVELEAYSTITDRAYVIFDGKIKIQGKSVDVANDPVAKEFYLGKDFQL